MACFLTCPDLCTNLFVSKEEFFSFHNIDRQLFTRLVVILGRDTSQSTHVMAFIMWLEKQCKDMKMIKNMLQWSNTMIDSLANEVILVLNCVESSQFPYDDVVNYETLPLIKSILQNKVANLKYFYDNRVTIIGAVTKLLNNVCVRAFIDIMHEVQHLKATKEQNLQIANIYGTDPYAKQAVYYTPLPSVTFVSQHVAIPTPQWSEGNSSFDETNINHPSDTCDVSYQTDFHQNFNDLLGILSETSITTSTSDENEKKEVSIDDRIIFMTFSKGYPISEAEVREFFTRRYGDIIEAFHMQDVVPPQQPLYARIVIRTEAIQFIDHLLESTNKVKLSIHGKHAWARKYVRKGNKSPMTSRAPSPTSRPSY